MGNNIIRTTKVIPCLLILVHIIPTENQCCDHHVVPLGVQK